MKLSLFSGLPHLLEEGGSDALIAFCQKMELHAVEGSPCSRLNTPSDAVALRHALDDAGIPCRCFSISADLSAEDGAPVLDRLREILEMAHILGSPYVHHTLVPTLTPPGVGTPSMDAIFDRVTQRAALLCDEAAKLGITCLYEDQGFYFNGCEPFQRMLSAVHRENAGVCDDFSNIYFADEDPLRFTGAFLPYIRHVHLKDYLYKSPEAADPGEGWLTTRTGGRLRDVIFGHGIVPFVPLFTQLLRGGYDGYYSLEYGSEEPFEDGMRRSIDNVRRYYAQARQALSLPAEA